MSELPCRDSYVRSMRNLKAFYPSDHDAIKAYIDQLEAYVERTSRTPQPVTPEGGEVVRGEATGDTTTFKDAWARLSPIDRTVISIYFQETHPHPVTPAGDVPFATVREVVKALTRLGTSTPESQEEQAARAVELIGLLCREVHGHFDELSKVTPEGGEVVYAVNTGELDESGKRELYTLTDEPIPMADNWKLYTHPPVADAALDLIAAERQRQIAAEGWTPEHDDEHGFDELALAAACYALPDESRGPDFTVLWPWSIDWWKPSPCDRIRELVKAGALIAAEIARLQRAALNQRGGGV